MTVHANIRIETLTSAGIPDWIDALATLRTRVFREYPYLYDGSDAYEREYLAHYAASSRAVVVLALDDSHVDPRAVGCSTGLPLTDADEEFNAPFERHGPPPAKVFYFGESVLLPEYRGRGLGHRFFDARETHAAGLGFSITAFCAVDRPADHPRRPSKYRPLDGFWQRRGYRRVPELQARFGWKEIGQDQETDHRLTFWLRDAASNPPEMGPTP